MAVNRALLGTRDEPTLSREVCRLLVKRGGYPAAWLCLADAAAPARLVVGARAGRRSCLPALVPCGAAGEAGCPLAAAGGAHGPVDGIDNAPLLLSLEQDRVLLGVLHVALRSGTVVYPEELQVLRELADSVAVRLGGLRAAWRHREKKNAMIGHLQRLQVSVETTPLVAVQSVDASGAIRHWNEASTRLYGFPAAQALNRRLGDLLFERERVAEFDRLVQRAWRTGEGTTAAEWEVLCADGARRWVFASLIPIREHDRVVDLFCLEVDITGRRQAEQALRDSEERYRTLIDAAPFAVLVHQAGRVSFANAAALEMLGARQPDELCFRPVASLVHPDSRAALAALAKAGSTGPTPLQLVRPDGGVLEVEIATVPLRLHDRPAEQWLLRDVTQAKRMEQELTAARAKLARIFECSPAAILICGLPDHRVLEVNPAGLELLGRERDEVAGRLLTDLGLGAAVPLGMRGGGGGSSDRSGALGEIEVHPRHGAARHALVSADDFDFGAQPCRLFILIEVTERKRLEIELQESQKLEAMGLLARGVAHDLNNILTVIQGHQSLIRLQRDLPRRVVDSVDGIAEAVERAAELTRQLLTFSRRRPFEPQPVSVNDLLARSERLIRRLLGPGIELVRRLGERVGRVRADAGMLEQVVMNLAVNARDAMPRGGRLTLTTEARFVRNPPVDRQPLAQPGDYVCLGVHDTGLGIPAAHLPQVFEPFFTTKGARQGTGLGLTTVRNIVHQHQGWIDVESRESGGTVFRVFLPALAESASLGRSKPRRIRPAGRGLTVLLVEDDPAVQALVRGALERGGFRVLTAVDGPGAIRLWSRHGAAIRLVFADLHLPGGLDGAELIARFQAERPGLRAVLSTGYGTELDPHRLGRLRHVRLLPKPFAPDAVARFVRECLADR